MGVRQVSMDEFLREVEEAARNLLSLCRRLGGDAVPLWKLRRESRMDDQLFFMALCEARQTWLGLGVFEGGFVEDPRLVAGGLSVGGQLFVSATVLPGRG